MGKSLLRKQMDARAKDSRKTYQEAEQAVGSDKVDRFLNRDPLQPGRHPSSSGRPKGSLRQPSPKGSLPEASVSPAQQDMLNRGLYNDPKRAAQRLDEISSQEPQSIETTE